MRLATIAELRARVGIAEGDTAHDALLGTMLDAATAAIEKYCDRGCVYPYPAGGASLTEIHDGGCELLYLRYWPVASIGAIVETLDGDYDSAVPLPDTDYLAVTYGTHGEGAADRARGRVMRMPRGARWLAGASAVAVTYRGGWLDPRYTPGPLDPPLITEGHALRSACVEQAAYQWQRRDQLGAGGVSMVGPSAGALSPAREVALLDFVKEMLQGERRL